MALAHGNCPSNIVELSSLAFFVLNITGKIMFLLYHLYLLFTYFIYFFYYLHCRFSDIFVMRSLYLLGIMILVIKYMINMFNYAIVILVFFSYQKQSSIILSYRHLFGQETYDPLQITFWFMKNRNIFRGWITKSLLKIKQMTKSIHTTNITWVTNFLLVLFMLDKIR